MRKREGNLTFEFKTALGVDAPEAVAQPLKCVDFVADDGDATWMIEVTDATKAPPNELKRASAELLGQMSSGSLTKDMLMKLYGTHAHLALTGVKPRSKLFFCVIIGVPPSKTEAARRIVIRDHVKRVTDLIGPSFHGARRPVVQVESISTWNANNPAVQILP